MMAGDLLGQIRVLDFTLAAVGPFSTRILADLGAEVIHVEYPRLRWRTGSTGREASRFNRAADGRVAKENELFMHVNSGKKSLAVNLKTEEGVSLIHRLVAKADVVIENMTPRVKATIGLEYRVLAELNPAIVMCSMTGFGQEGL